MHVAVRCGFSCKPKPKWWSNQVRLADTPPNARDHRPPSPATRTPCPLCVASDDQDGRDVDPGDASIVYACSPSLEFRRCDRCGIAYRTIPQNVEDQYDERYSESITAGFRSEGKQSHAVRTLGRITHFGLRNGALLDIGCADGAFLEVAGKQGWRVCGVERQESSAALARARGLTVYSPSIDALPAGMRFDVITLLDVIEHIREPLPFLERLWAMLTPGGMLYLETPNFGSIYRHACGQKWMGFILHHEILYSERALASLLRRSGFSDVLTSSDRGLPFSYDGLRRLRHHNLAFNMLAAHHALLVRAGIRKKGSPVVTAPGFLTRLINAPFDALVNRGLRRGDQLIVMAKCPANADQVREVSEKGDRKSA